MFRIFEIIPAAFRATRGFVRAYPWMCVFAAAVYLATDMSRWTNGQTIVLDGGAMAGAGWRMMADGRWTNSPITHEAHWAYGTAKP